MSGTKSKEMDLTVGSPFWSLLKFAIPVILGNLFQLFYTLADSVIVGKTLGANSLAAVGSTSIIIYFVFCFINGFTGGFGICLGQRCGAKDEKGMRKSVAASTLLSIIFTIVLTLICCLLAHQILRWMQIPSDISGEAYDYMFVVLLGTGATVFYNMISNMLRALGDSKTPLYFLVFSSVLNIFLDVLFIVPLHMGVAGAAWATVLSQLISGILCFLYMRKQYDILKFEKDEMKFEGRQAIILCNMGIPMGLQYSITAIGSVILQTAVNSLGSQAVAAVTAAGRISGFSCCPFDALGSTMATYAGQNVGAGKLDRVGKGLKSASFIGGIYAIIAFFVLSLFGRQIALLFVSADEIAILDHVKQFLVFNTAFYIPLCLVNTVRFCIQGMGYSRLAILAGVCEMVGRIIASLVLVPLIGFVGICIASPIAWIMADLFLVPAYCHTINRMKKILAS